MKWTNKDKMEAQSEGWDIFESSNGITIERLDDPDEGVRYWESDDEVRAWIRAHPTALHIKALAIEVAYALTQEDPTE